MTGLSPHVRGNHHRERLVGPRPGSIPARAGEPSPDANIAPGSRVYPRTCGGTETIEPPLGAWTGLSPHVRGNRSVSAGDCPGRGSIPARAGEPGACARTRSPRRVYPRTCGGTIKVSSNPGDVVGLSPHVRGNLAQEIPDLVLGRSIPARAGEPPAHAAQSPGTGVYPRTCGGTFGDRRQTCWWTGLSPHVRGNLLQGQVHIYAIGSIPARAGEPATRW